MTTTPPNTVCTLGSTTPTTSFSGIAVLSNPPAGTYDIDVTTWLGGTVVTASDQNNFQFLAGGINETLMQPGPSSGIAPPIKSSYRATLNGSQSVIVQTNINTPSGTAVYMAFIQATLVSGEFAMEGTGA